MVIHKREMSATYNRLPSASTTSTTSPDIRNSHTSPSLEEDERLGQEKKYKHHPLHIARMFFRNMKASFASLEHSPRELYVNFFLHFCDSYSYFALSQILVMYLHNNFGVSDLQAGAAYGMWGAAITFWGFVMGCFNDRMGIRRSLLTGFTISLLSNFMIAVTTSKTVVLFVLFCLLPIGNCMGIPMLTVGVKRFTNKLNRGFAFGLYYSVMNVAALLSGPVVDFCNIVIASNEKTTAYWSGNRFVVCTVVLSNLVSLLVTFFFMRDIPQQELLASDEDDIEGSTTEMKPSVESMQNKVSTIVSRTSAAQQTGEEDATETVEFRIFRDGNEESNMKDMAYRTSNENESIPRHPSFPSLSPTSSHSHASVVYSALHESSPSTSASKHRIVSSQIQMDNVIGDDNHSSDNLDSSDINSKSRDINSSQESMPEIVSTLLCSITFWRFCMFTLFLINLKMIFRHLDATLPTYLVRCFGNSYPKGMIYSINPFMIIWVTPVVAAMTSKWPHYDMIKYGGYVSAISPFFLAMSTSTGAIVIFMILLSLGESIWSPRLYDYTMSIAPQGREATFSALAAAPLFAAKIPVGLLSGYLLSHYLPEDESGGNSYGSEERKKNGQLLWLIVGLLTM